jgi:CO/xanthine dehydrogenase FAD-binding subunit
MIMSNAHPSLPRFELFQPVTLAEASQFLTVHKEDARPFLGGTDLFVRMRDGNLNPATLVNLKSIPGLNEMRFDPVEGLTIGSAVVMNHVIASADAQQHYPLLVEAARSVASYQLRNRATVVGNICNASPAGDTIGAALLYKGELRIYSPAGDKVLPLEDFFIGPGKTKLKTGEIVSALYIPPPPIGHQSRYYKLGRNVISDLSIVGVAVLGFPDATAKSSFRFRIALASVAPTPLVVHSTEEILASQPITEEVIQKAAEATKQACSPIDDVRSSAAYRRAMIERCTYRAVRDVWQRLQKDSPA